jgi:mRNA degradation ribonuclease J1/J2
MAKFQSHCSGHARRKDLTETISIINPEILFPIHTEHPELFQKISKVNNVKEGVEYILGQ